MKAKCLLFNFVLTAPWDGQLIGGGHSHLSDTFLQASTTLLYCRQTCLVNDIKVCRELQAQHFFPSPTLLAQENNVPTLHVSRFRIICLNKLTSYQKHGPLIWKINDEGEYETVLSKRVHECTSVCFAYRKYLFQATAHEFVSNVQP